MKEKDYFLSGTLQKWADPPGLITRAHRKSQNPENSSKQQKVYIKIKNKNSSKRYKSCIKTV